MEKCQKRLSDSSYTYTICVCIILSHLHIHKLSSIWLVTNTSFWFVFLLYIDVEKDWVCQRMKVIVKTGKLKEWIIKKIQCKHIDKYAIWCFTFEFILMIHTHFSQLPICHDHFHSVALIYKLWNRMEWNLLPIQSDIEYVRIRRFENNHSIYLFLAHWIFLLSTFQQGEGHITAFALNVLFTHRLVGSSTVEIFCVCTQLIISYYYSICN